jgi:hypothetical protein
MPLTPHPNSDASDQSGIVEPARKWLLPSTYLKPAQLARAFRSGVSKWRRLVNGMPRAERGEPPPPMLVRMVNETDALLAAEVRDGCTNEIEALLDGVRRTILEDKLLYSKTLAEDHALDRLWVNLLRLGLFDELQHLLRHHEMPLRPEVKAFADYCEREYDTCRRRGEAFRAKYPDEDVFTLGCIVWGEEYVGNFLRYNLRSMLSPNNLRALRMQGRLVCSIVTDTAGEQRMRQHPVFAELSDIADVEFIVTPDEIMRILARGHLVQNFYMLYGMLDHCSIYFAQGAASHLFMIPVDSIVADGSLANMANWRHEGYECCGGGNIVAETETFLPALAARYGDEGPISISTEELATLAVEHAHHYFRSQVIAVENQDFGKHPRELFWAVNGGVEIHSVFIHPLFTSASGLARYSRKHFANIDYGMIPRMFSKSSSIKIIEDPRQAYVNNFTAGGRRYETTGRAFSVEDFLRCHDWTYPVQKGLFERPQVLPCRLNGWTMSGSVSEDVKTISERFGIAGQRGKAEHQPHEVSL